MSAETNNALHAIKERIGYLYDSGDMSDCEFEFSNSEKIKAHKVILGVASPVFKAMLFGDLKNKTGPEKIEEIDPEIFKKMLQFIYTDDVEFDSVETACLVYAAGEKYILPDLKTHCEKYIVLHVNISTVFYLLDFIRVYESKLIQSECYNFIRSETVSVLRWENFLRLDLYVLKTIAEQPALNINSELELFKAVERWAKNKAEEKGVSLSEIAPSLSEVIGKLRFLSMDSTEFAEGPGISELLSVNDKLALSLNIHSPGISPIPKYLCLLRKQRPPRVTYQYTFTNVSGNLTTNGVYSQLFSVRSTSWKLQLAGKPLQNNKFTDVVLYIWFNGDNSNSLATCTANIELKFVAKKKGVHHLKTCFRQKFNRDENSWKNPFSIDKSTAFDRDCGFLVNNSITVEASVEPDPEPEEF